MIIHDVAQGSGDWFRLRMGIPTASCFDQIVTPKTGAYSKSARRYAYKLITERLLNSPLDSVEGIEWMDRGKELEPQAVKQYEWVNEVETLPVGFITTDDGLFGASPDRLIKGRAAGLEVKCPAPHTHLGYLLDGHNDTYRPQVQGQLYVAELEQVDFYSFHPRMPACTIRTHRDEPYIKLIRNALSQFNDDLADMLARAKALGVFQAYEEIRTPTDAARADELRGEFVGEEFGLPP